MKSKLDDIIKMDLYRYRPNPYSINQLVQGFRSQGFRYTYCLRKYKHSRNVLIKLFYKYLLVKYRYKFGFQISYKAQIGEGFYIGHYGTIIISANAIIGNNCNISPGVTIGRDHRGKRKGTPKIGNNVWIGTNSVIVGKIIIGNDVLVAPNSFINFDVPDHSIIIGNPGKIIHKTNATNGYINNTITYFSKMRL